MWNGVKCNFSSPHHHVRKIVGMLSIRRIRMWNFTRIGHDTKKVMAFDSFGTKAVLATRLGTTPKRCELQLFFAGILRAVRRYKAIHLGCLNMQFQQDWPKDKKLQLLQFFGWKLRKISLDWALWCGSRGIDNFFLSQLFGLYVNGKLSISWFEICNVQQQRM